VRLLDPEIKIYVIRNSTMGGGSGAWTPSRPPGGNVSAGGVTPGSRNQDLPLFIPNPTLWGTPCPSRSPGSFGAGGTTPGPRNQDLPPVIPNPTLSGGGWTPSHAAGIFCAGGATPGPRNQDLPSGVVVVVVDHLINPGSQSTVLLLLPTVDVLHPSFPLVLPHLIQTKGMERMWIGKMRTRLQFRIRR